MLSFNPVEYSYEENQWLLDNLDKPPVIALQHKPSNVNVNAVKPLLDRVLELNQMQTHQGTPWVGIDAIKAAIRVYLEMDAKWDRAHKRNKDIPRFPSLYSFDVKGRAILGGPGSDSGMVRTYFDEQGNRVPFAIDLTYPEPSEWEPPTFTEQPSTTKLVVNQALNRIECFCGHTETFKDGSRSSYNAARGRISKHMRTSRDRQNEHLEAHTEEFRR